MFSSDCSMQPEKNDAGTTTAPLRGLPTAQQ